MSDIVINGKTYRGVQSISVINTDGETVTFTEGSGNVANDIINGTITEVTSETLSGVESIRSNAFSGMEIETVSVPSNVTSVGDSAFANNNITTLTIDEGVQTIGNNAFQNNSIKMLTIPSSVTSIGDGAFSGNNLTEITMESDNPPIVTSTTFPSTLQTTNVSYNGYENYSTDPNWTTYKNTLVRGLAIPSTITVTVNNYLGELVSGASVTISGNGQTYMGTTNESGVFTQGDLQPATYEVSVADLDGFKTPEPVDVVVEENTQNSVTITYLEQTGIKADPVFGNNSPEVISAVGDEIATKGYTSSQVEEIYGWKIGDTTSYTLSTGENVEMRITGFNHDDLSNGSGKAGITLEMTHCLRTLYPMNESDTNNGGYPASEMKTTTLPTIKSTLPQEWQDVIVMVNKKSANGGTNYSETLTLSEDLFLLSEVEVFGSVSGAQDGANEGGVYEYWNGKTATDRIKRYDKNADGVVDSAVNSWLRSSNATNNHSFAVVGTGGTYNYYRSYMQRGVSYAFCVGSPPPPVYGVSWTNDETTTMTRTDNAVNMTYSINTSTGKVTSDFDKVFPYNQMKRQVVGGNTFVYVPKMWFRVVADSDQKITSIAVSSKKGDGDNWYQTRPFYYGAYAGSSDGSVLKSVSGVTRQFSITRADARARAMNVGVGYHQRDLYAGTILMFLWWIEFATKNSSSVMTGAQYPKTSGGTLTIYNEQAGNNFCVSGYNTSTSQMVWHGIEDYIGNGYEWEDGITGDGTSGGKQYVSDDYTLYDDYSTSSQMPELSFNSLTTEGSCVEALGWDASKPFLCQPIAIRNDNNYVSGFCDYSSKSNRALSCRGCANPLESFTGISTFDRAKIDTVSANIGCRLVLNA